MNSLRIALAQIDGTVGDLSGNAARIGDYLDQAREVGADLIIFPQLALSGYPPRDLLRRSAFLEANQRALMDLVERTAGITAIIGCIDTDSGVQNAAAVLHDGEIAGIRGKERLSTLPYIDEKRYFEPARSDTLFRIADRWIGITIGDELAPASSAVARLARAGADLIVNLAADPFMRGQSQTRRHELSAAAREGGVAIAYVNRVGGQDELVFAGGSMVVASSGEIIAEAHPLREELLTSDLPESASAEGAPVHMGTAEEPGATPPIASITTHIERRTLAPPEVSAPRAPLPPPEPVRHDDLAETYEALTIGIRDYARKNGFDHLVLGLSGGLDSALVATLAADALGSDAVTTVWMPSRYSTELSRSDAVALADRLGVELLSIPIEAAFSAFLELLQPHFGDRAPDLTEENLQARVRGSLLMALSNKFGWLVLTTSNKSETAVGYTTLYGDMAGGLAPLKDVPKTLVVELARWRNTRDPVIPVSTIERPPTAELRPDQLDTDSLPPYEVLDPILERYLELGWSAQRIIAEGADQATVHRLIGLVDRGEYKRRQPPPGIKITSYPFGVDDQMPMTSRYREV
jgi:NAD+ synthase (glutamine-hydrolysing)